MKNKLASVIASIFFPCVVFAVDDTCSREGNELECLDLKIQSAEGELNQRFKDALAKLPDSHPEDNRKMKLQLEKAQAAWLNFRNEHCAHVGGIEGGSNKWVTQFAGECELKETLIRIKFFQESN